MQFCLLLLLLLYFYFFILCLVDAIKFLKINLFCIFYSFSSFIHLCLGGLCLLILKIGQPWASQGLLGMNQYLLVQVEIALFSPLLSMLPRPKPKPKPSTTKVNLFFFFLSNSKVNPYFHKPSWFFEKVLTLHYLESR